MKACSCGNQVAVNARFCPQCGKRFTSPLTMGFAVILGFGVLMAIIAAVVNPNAQEPSHKATFDPVNASIGGCQLWTRANSKLAVADFVSEYKIKARLPKGTYKVGLDYRTKGAGLMMHSTCEYKDAGDHDHMLLVKAWSGL